MKGYFIQFFLLTAITSLAQTETLKYQFVNWYISNLGDKKIYIDRLPNYFSKVDLGTEVETYIGCGRPIMYDKKIIEAFDELKISYDTLLLNNQITQQSLVNFLQQDKLEKGKIISFKLSPWNHSFLGEILSPFRHSETLCLSIPIWTDNNKIVIVKSSLLSRQSKAIRKSKIEIYQIRDNKTFDLIKVIDEKI